MFLQYVVQASHTNRKSVRVNAAVKRDRLRV